jgi:hypothetical protein
MVHGRRPGFLPGRFGIVFTGALSGRFAAASPLTSEYHEEKAT